jgi:hypothetical protein
MLEIEDKTLETTTLVNSKDRREDAIKNANINNIKEVHATLLSLAGFGDKIGNNI